MHANVRAQLKISGIFPLSSTLNKIHYFGNCFCPSSGENVIALCCPEIKIIGFLMNP
jgi:hypothetical protein